MSDEQQPAYPHLSNAQTPQGGWPAVPQQGGPVAGAQPAYAPVPGGAPQGGAWQGQGGGQMPFRPAPANPPQQAQQAGYGPGSPYGQGAGPGYGQPAYPQQAYGQPGGFRQPGPGFGISAQRPAAPSGRKGKMFLYVFLGLFVFVLLAVGGIWVLTSSVGKMTTKEAAVEAVTADTASSNTATAAANGGNMLIGGWVGAPANAADCPLSLIFTEDSITSTTAGETTTIPAKYKILEDGVRVVTEPDGGFAMEKYTGHAGHQMSVEKGSTTCTYAYH